jgi:hypothetical protein
MAAADTNNSCGCSCICDPTVARVLDQAMAKYADRSAYANNNQQDNQTLLLSMFQTQAQNSLETTPQTDMVALVGQLGMLMKSGTNANA